MNDKQKYTAPWKISEDGPKTAIEDANRRHIAMVNYSTIAKPHIIGEEHKRIAQLISLSPELAEALRNLVDNLPSCFMEWAAATCALGTNFMPAIEARDQARALLEKLPK